MKANKAIFLAIVIISAFLRVFMLSSIPNGFFSDEASSGYDAYSILLTGNDRHWNFMPLLFRSFDDYVPPLFNYSLVPFIFLLGLSEISVRIAAAFFGVLTVIFTYLLTKRIFDERAALFASLFLAISPWHIQFSRYGGPAITLHLFFTAGLYFLYRGLSEKRYIPLGAVLFGLCLYTYAIAKLFVPLFLIGFFLIYRRKILKKKKEFFIGLILLAVISAPIAYLSLFGEGQKRFNEISIFSEYEKSMNEPLTIKEAISYVKSFFNNYFKYFSVGYLFVEGDNEKRHSINGVGQLYWFELPLLLVGLFLFLKKRISVHKLLLWWLLIYPLAASLTTGGIHAIRSINALPLFQIISAYSISSLLDSLKLKKSPFIIIIFLILISLLAVYNVGSYVYGYFIEYPKYSAESFQYGKKDAISYIESAKRGYNKLVVPEEDEIFVLFYTKFKPGEYQRNKLKNSQYSFCFIRECCMPGKNN